MALNAEFKAKIGHVNHHQLSAGGNADVIVYEEEVVEIYHIVDRYYTYYVNIAAYTASDKRMKVKFYAPNNSFVQKYEWRFGDGSDVLITTIPEVEHTYNLETKDAWLGEPLPLPFDETATGRYASVTLSVFGYDGAIADFFGSAAIYEVTKLIEPILVSPEQTTADIPLTFAAKWRRTTGATFYAWQISKDATFATGVQEKTGIDQQYGSTPNEAFNDIVVCGSNFTLETYTIYYWRIRAYNSDYTSPWTGPYMFITGGS